MKTKTTLYALTTFISIFSLSVLASNPIQIEAKEKSGGKTKGEKRELLRSEIQKDSKKIYYEFQIRSMHATNLNVKAEWVVLVENVFQDRLIGTKGLKNLNLKPGKMYNIETEEINLALRKLEQDHRYRKIKKKIEENIYGYGIRLKNAEGKIIASKFSSMAKETEIAQFFEKEKEPLRKTLPTRRRGKISRIR